MCAVCCLLLGVRIYQAQHFYYLFLVWNLFLAIIPLAISYRLYKHCERKKGRYFLVLSMGCLWLLFFPNAPYILTDFVHLYPRHSIPMWFDGILLFCFAMTGLLSGLISLYFMHQILAKIFSKKITKLLIASIIILSGYGIYLGRVLRWNSWDILINPLSLIRDSLFHIGNKTAIGMTILFSLIIFSTYLLLLTFLHFKEDDKYIHEDN